MELFLIHMSDSQEKCFILEIFLISDIILTLGIVVY